MLLPTGVWIKTMPSLIKLLSPVKAKEVDTGEIIQRQADGMYQVKIGRQTLSMRSLIIEKLSKGTQVVVVQTDKGPFIINKERIKDRQKLEVIIDG